jgi:hypothetical protein
MDLHIPDHMVVVQGQGLHNPHKDSMVQVAGMEDNTGVVERKMHYQDPRLSILQQIRRGVVRLRKKSGYRDVVLDRDNNSSLFSLPPLSLSRSPSIPIYATKERMAWAFN